MDECVSTVFFPKGGGPNSPIYANGSSITPGAGVGVYVEVSYENPVPPCSGGFTGSQQISTGLPVQKRDVEQKKDETPEIVKQGIAFIEYAKSGQAFDEDYIQEHFPLCADLIHYYNEYTLQEQLLFDANELNSTLYKGIFGVAFHVCVFDALLMHLDSLYLDTKANKSMDKNATPGLEFLANHFPGDAWHTIAQYNVGVYSGRVRDSLCRCLVQTCRHLADRLSKVECKEGCVIFAKKLLDTAHWIHGLIPNRTNERRRVLRAIVDQAKRHDRALPRNPF